MDLKKIFHGKVSLWFCEANCEVWMTLSIIYGFCARDACNRQYYYLSECRTYKSDGEPAFLIRNFLNGKWCSLCRKVKTNGIIYTYWFVFL